MEGALWWARNTARLRGPDAAVGRDDLHARLLRATNQKLGALARRLKSAARWRDLTLPPTALAQLREIGARVRNRRTVHEDWGFATALGLSKGLCALFYGPSGVGKTMGIEVLAGDLKLEVYKIDLSAVVSKYIGETEKNLGRIFDEAESSNAILFFDEADALFGKRSEVKDAHDRYANIETSYLLQRMEEYQGLVMLATNLRKNIDEAFFRRMHFAVEFPLPDASHRYRIWEQHFPERAPVADDVSLDFLADRFPISGGEIRNVVVNAAFLAAADSGTDPHGAPHTGRAARVREVRAALHREGFRALPGDVEGIMIIRRATVSIQNGKCSRERAERIVRSMFQHMHAAISGERRAGAIGRVAAPPLDVSFARSDEAIGRDAAAWTARWIAKGR